MISGTKIGLGLFLLLFLALALVFLGRAQQSTPGRLSLGSTSDHLSPGPNDPVTNSLATTSPATPTPMVDLPPVSSSANPPSASQVPVLLSQGLQFLEQKRLDDALAKANAAIQAAPQDSDGYELRATIYLEKKLWDQASKDYQTALQFDGKNVLVRFNLADIQFMQKRYAAARPGFVAVEQDPDMGDIASYKVFLCDLLGGQEDVAAKELDAFNQVGSNASYYFANAAWSLYHHKTEDGRGWLTSATNIYPPEKCRFYAISLVNLGYLPLPPPQQ